MPIQNRKPERHGLSRNGTKHPIYKLRESILYRCYSVKENRKDYQYYRSKGIKVCDEWINSVQAFYDWCVDKGYRKGLTLDRIDSLGDYSPDNCQLITLSENSKKARREHNQNGESSSNVKLVEQDIMVIRMLSRLGYTQKRIAKFFGMGKTSIGSIIRRKSWKHIQGEL